MGHPEHLLGPHHHVLLPQGLSHVDHEHLMSLSHGYGWILMGLIFCHGLALVYWLHSLVLSTRMRRAKSYRELMNDPDLLHPGAGARRRGGGRKPRTRVGRGGPSSWLGLSGMGVLTRSRSAQLSHTFTVPSDSVQNSA